MQKKIIALAVAALASGAAFAQSNVTIYGIADMYVGSFKTDDAKRSTQVNSGGLSTSRIGFKGAEDLGNGLKAIFALEYALAIDNSQGTISNVSSTDAGLGAVATGVDPNGNPATSSGSNGSGIGQARQQMVGLTGGFGTAVAGRLQTTAYDWAVSYDALAGTAISPLQSVNATNFVIGGTTAGARANNALAYISPSFGGVTLAYNRGYVAEQGATTAFDNSAIADMLSANYKNGPLAAGIVYSRVNDNSTSTAAGKINDKMTDWALGASYDFGVAKAFGTYQRSKSKGYDNTLNTSYNDNADKAWSLGVSVPVSAAGAVIASYAKNSIRSTDTAAASPSDNSSAYTLAYTHGLSKRTTAYAGYTKLNRGNDILVNVTGAANNTLATGAGGRDTSAMVAGIRHAF